MTCCACASVHSFLRKLRSTLTRAPAARAAAQARRVPSAPLAPSAGVMPVTCSQSAPFIVAAQSTASGFISAIEELARS